MTRRSPPPPCDNQDDGWSLDENFICSHFKFTSMATSLLTTQRRKIRTQKTIGNMMTYIQHASNSTLHHAKRHATEKRVGNGAQGEVRVHNYKSSGIVAAKSFKNGDYYNEETLMNTLIASTLALKAPELLHGFTFLLPPLDTVQYKPLTTVEELRAKFREKGLTENERSVLSHTREKLQRPDKLPIQVTLPSRRHAIPTKFEPLPMYRSQKLTPLDRHHSRYMPSLPTMTPMQMFVARGHSIASRLPNTERTYYMNSCNGALDLWDWIRTNHPIPYPPTPVAHGWRAMLLFGSSNKNAKANAANARKWDQLALRLVHLTTRMLLVLHADHTYIRDIKPENFIVCPGEQPRMIDFGLASKLNGPRLPNRFSGTRGYLHWSNLRLFKHEHVFEVGVDGVYVDKSQTYDIYSSFEKSDMFAFGKTLMKLTSALVARRSANVDDTHNGPQDSRTVRDMVLDYARDLMSDWPYSKNLRTLLLESKHATLLARAERACSYVTRTITRPLSVVGGGGDRVPARGGALARPGSARPRDARRDLRRRREQVGAAREVLRLTAVVAARAARLVQRGRV
jgi:hypothetical protein